MALAAEALSAKRCSGCCIDARWPHLSILMMYEFAVIVLKTAAGARIIPVAKFIADVNTPTGTDDWMTD